ncbi:MAG: 2-oxoacid:acceptor oxidoreductase family protein [Proteobacteria bacterium]|nr:2-oxoacid:acceptor oxidoreductase family protein [Pseudomonadota bacterium]
MRATPLLPGPRIEIILAGSGGQGMILAGLILAEAAGLYDGRQVAMVQNYGPEARGGTSKAEVILSDQTIDYPLCTAVDVLLALTQEAADVYHGDLKPGGWLIVDQELVPHPPLASAISLPFTRTARRKLKREMVTNVVALGFLSGYTGLVTKKGMERALLSRIPLASREMNKKALRLGSRLATAYQNAVPGARPETDSNEI